MNLSTRDRMRSFYAGVGASAVGAYLGDPLANLLTN